MNGLKHFAHVTICLPLDFIQKRELSGGAILFREYHTLRVLLYSLTRAPHSLTSSRREKKELIWSGQGLCVLKKSQRQNLQSGFRMNTVVA